MAQRRRCGSFGSLPYIERRAIDVEYGELTTRWRYSHVRSPPLAEAATPPEVVAQYRPLGIEAHIYIYGSLMAGPARADCEYPLTVKDSVG